MNPSRRPPLFLEARLSAAAALGAACLYLSFPAARYNFDGVACAIAVELGDLRHLLHGNHLAYGFLGWVWFSGWKALGYAGPALQCLQVFSSLLGALAAGAFARLLLRCGLRPLLAAAGSAGLAFSNVYWIWSVEAQVYALGSFFLFLAAAEAVLETPDPTRLGLYHAGAILGHVGHSMFFPAACWMLWSGRPGYDPRTLRRYVFVLAGAIAAAYAAGLLCIRPQSWDELQTWLLGSAALGIDRKFAWIGGYSPAGFLEWTKTTASLFINGVQFGVPSLALAAAGAWSAWRRRRRIVTACLTWLLGYAVLFTCWQPGRTEYRVTDLAPLWLLILLAIETFDIFRPRWKRLSALGIGVATAVLGIFNLIRTALPDGDPIRNVGLQRSLWVARRTPENAWVIVDSADQVYIPYFAHRRPLNLRYFGGGGETALRERVDALWRDGEPVFAVPQALSPAWQERLKSQRLREEDRRGDETLFSVLPSPAKIGKP